MSKVRGSSVGTSAGADESHLSVSDRAARGRAARQAVPRTEHAAWSPSSSRRDPVVLLDEQNRARVPWLVPIRHGRMMASPLAFYRGAARLMAGDLATATPSSGFIVQTCGDAHLANFGVYASPERQLVFDINDFDETLPGPWEWDVKRLATSFMIACRQQRLDDAACASVTQQAVAGYRTGMGEAAAMRSLDVWYDHLTTEKVLKAAEWLQRRARQRVAHFEQRARTRDSLHALNTLAVEEDGRFRIRSDPPVLLPLREIPEIGDPATVLATVRATYESPNGRSATTAELCSTASVRSMSHRRLSASAASARAASSCSSRGATVTIRSSYR